MQYIIRISNYIMHKIAKHPQISLFLFFFKCSPAFNLHIRILYRWCRSAPLLGVMMQTSLIHSLETFHGRFILVFGFNGDVYIFLKMTHYSLFSVVLVSLRQIHEYGRGGNF